MTAHGRNLLARAAWTAIQAGVAVVFTDVTQYPVWLAVPLAALLSAVKTQTLGTPVPAPTDAP